MSASNKELTTLIDIWINENIAHGCAGVPQDRIDELKDHLMCVAESRLEDGASVQDAMLYATKQFGDVKEVKEQLTASSSAFRRWLGRVHCKRAPVKSVSDKQTVMMSMVIAAALLISAWLAQDNRTYAFISTILIGMWVVLAYRQGGTREAARAEWRWLKGKLGL